jgi:hypothetical protein
MKKRVTQGWLDSAWSHPAWIKVKTTFVDFTFVGDEPGPVKMYLNEGEDPKAKIAEIDRLWKIHLEALKEAFEAFPPEYEDDVPDEEDGE